MNLKEWMWKNRWSQKRLAQALGISHVTINEICGNKHTPSLYIAFLLYKASKKQIDLASLLTPHDSQKIQEKLKDFEEAAKIP